MEEWATNSSVLQETVRATVDAFAQGQIKLPEVELQSKVPNQIKTAPSFISFSISVRSGERRGGNSNKNPLYYTNHTLAEFLGWVTDNGKPQDRVTDATAALAFIEQGYLEQNDFRDLSPKETGALLRTTGKTIKKHRQSGKDPPWPGYPAFRPTPAKPGQYDGPRAGGRERAPVLWLRPPRPGVQGLSAQTR